MHVAEAQRLISPVSIDITVSCSATRHWLITSIHQALVSDNQEGERVEVIWRERFQPPGAPWPCIGVSRNRVDLCTVSHVQPSHRHDYLGTLPARRRLDSGLAEAAATAPCVNVDDSASHQIYFPRICCEIKFREKLSPACLRRGRAFSLNLISNRNV